MALQKYVKPPRNGFVEAKKGREIFNNSFPQQTSFGDEM